MGALKYVSAYCLAVEQSALYPFRCLSPLPGLFLAAESTTTSTLPANSQTTGR